MASPPVVERSRTNGRRLIDDLLHGVLDELVERSQLLAHETLLLEVRRDDDPRVVLRDLLVILVAVVVYLAPRRRLMCVGGQLDHV